MNRSNKKISLIICAMLVSMTLLMTGCSTFESFRHTFIETGSVEEQSRSAVPTITIGIIEAETGKGAEKGREVIKGIELANSIYSNVNGFEIKLLKVDTKSNVTGAEAGIEALVAMKPVAIIGPSREATALVVSDNIVDSKIPAITPSATNPLITQSNGYYFRGCLTESQMGEGLAEYAYDELGSRRVASITLKNDSNTAALMDGFQEKLKSYNSKGKASLETMEIAPTTEELTMALNQLKKSKSDVCLVSLGNEAMDEFFTLVEDLGMRNVTFLGTKTWGDAKFVKMMEKHQDIKVVFPYSSVIDADSTEANQTMEAERFKIEYTNKYGIKDFPTQNAALGYDAYLLLVNAIHTAKSLDGPDVREAISNIKNLHCVTGVFAFDAKGNLVRTVSLSTIDFKSGSGTIVQCYVTKDAAEAKELETIEAKQEAEEEAEKKTVDASEDGTTPEDSEQENSEEGAEEDEEE